jgi:hypothetical protein
MLDAEEETRNRNFKMKNETMMMRRTNDVLVVVPYTNSREKLLLHSRTCRRLTFHFHL